MSKSPVGVNCEIWKVEMYNGCEVERLEAGNLWVSFSLDPLKCKGYKDLECKIPDQCHIKGSRR